MKGKLQTIILGITASKEQSLCYWCKMTCSLRANVCDIGYHSGCPKYLHISCRISLNYIVYQAVPICMYIYARPRSCHRSTTSEVESSLSQETKGPEQLLDSPTRLLGLPVVAGLGRAVENFGEVA